MVVKTVATGNRSLLELKSYFPTCIINLCLIKQYENNQKISPFRSGFCIFRILARHIQSWPKILAPLQFCQKMQPFSQKIVAVANVLVLTCSFLWFAVEQQKKNRRKIKSDTNLCVTECYNVHLGLGYQYLKPCLVTMLYDSLPFSA